MSSLLSKEVIHFRKLAQAWQNPNGPLYTLHRLNPTRLAYIRKFAAVNASSHRESNHKMQNVQNDSTIINAGTYYTPIVDNCLDIGCGAGIATQELSNWCRHVKGVEPTDALVDEAPKIANVTYHRGLVEDLVQDEAAKYDLVTALEVVEHVADPEAFVKDIATVMKPGATLVMSTLNRTHKSWLLGIVAAEYITGIVPMGTHNWNQFVKPEELLTIMAKYGLEVIDVTGVIYNPVTQTFTLDHDDTSVNYMLAARKKSDSPKQSQEQV